MADSSDSPTSAKTPEITYRPIRDDADKEFLYLLYASTRAHEMAVVPWSDEEKEQFLRQQFHAQTEFYNEHYRENAEFDLILIDGEPKGRLYLSRREKEFRIIDIALLPALRNKGIGGKIMSDIIGEADGAGKPVTIHVEQNNPAMHLYERLGFVKIEDQGVYWLMERPCGDS